MSKPAGSQWVLILALALAASSRPVSAATIPAAYSFAGAPTSVIESGNDLLLTGAAQGSVNAWSGVEFDTNDSVDLTTGLDNGTFTLTFPNGDQAFGNLFEDDSQVGDTGPFTQKLTFTGGTGEFADLSGVLSGAGYVSLDGYTSSGEGTLTAPALVATPEPGSWLLVLSGCGVALSGARKRIGAHTTGR